MKKIVYFGAFLTGFMVIASLKPVLAADPAPTPDAAMMEKMKQVGMPGPNHKILEPLAGTWKASVKMWMQPGAKAEESTGTSNNTWIHGGRFLKQEYEGMWAGQSFEGLGYMGYDNLREEFQSIWLDNMMTGIMKNSGTYDPKTKTISSSGTFSCPMTGEKERWFRTELKIVSNDKHTYTSYGKDPSGKEFKEMEITYTRTK